MSDTNDPCPGCRPGVRCRTPKCGRLKQDAQNKLLQAGKTLGSEIDEFKTPKYCCHACFAKTGGYLDRMLLCPTCGNKRCPKASDHELACTNSNEPGQLGSIYGGRIVPGAPDPDTPTDFNSGSW